MKKKIIKYSIVAIIFILIFILILFIYKNIFAGTESSRYKDIENYKLTNDEINSVKDKINEIELCLKTENKKFRLLMSVDLQMRLKVALLG